MVRGMSYTLLFDRDCRICSAFARALRLLDVRRALRIRTIQESESLLAAVPPQARLDTAHAVAPDGHVTSGAEAMPALVAALLAGANLERRLRASRASMAALSQLYRLMTEVRDQLSCASAAPASAGRTPR